MSHTILLVQPGARPETRTYSDYESVNECMEGVCKIYEEHLKRRNPNTPTITYDISQLFDFLDQVKEIPLIKNNLIAFYNYNLIRKWFNYLFLVGRFKLFGLSKINEHVCTVQ